MKLLLLAVIATALLIALGVSLVIPVFFIPYGTANANDRVPVMLSFDINDERNMPEWCDMLASTLAKYDIEATVFVAGKVADQYPQCVRNLAENENVDIGSKTYDHVALTSVSDFTAQLEQVKDGKGAVDRAGNIDTLSFRAPFGATDENIYALLNRSGILADFSYTHQYNSYQQGYYVRFDAISYGPDDVDGLFETLPDSKTPIIVNFDNGNNDSITEISEIIANLSEKDDVRLVNASDLTQMELTLRDRTTP